MKKLLIALVLAFSYNVNAGEIFGGVVWSDFDLGVNFQDLDEQDSGYYVGFGNKFSFSNHWGWRTEYAKLGSIHFNAGVASLNQVLTEGTEELCGVTLVDDYIGEIEIPICYTVPTADLQTITSVENGSVSVDIETVSLYLHGDRRLFDISKNPVRGYVEGGVSFMNAEISGLVSGRSGDIGAMAGLGAKISVSDHWSVDLGYRKHWNTLKLFGNEVDIEPSQLRLGATFIF